MTEREEHVFAFYVARAAAEFSMDPKFWPPIELACIIEDKMRFAVSRFGVADRATIENAARAFLDLLIAREAFSTSVSPYGPMYQFQRDAFRQCIAELIEANPIIAKAKDGGDDFWDDAFAALPA